MSAGGDSGNQKKFVIAAAVAAVGSAFAVESANIVGVNTAAGTGDFNWVVPCFQSIGKNTANIQLIGIVDPEATGDLGWGAETLDVLDNGGVPTVSYVYYDASNYPDPDDDAAPTDYYWGDETGALADENFDLAAGVCLTLVDGYQIKMAGEVPSRASFTAAGDFNWTGNPFPEAISIQAIGIVDPEATGDLGWGAETLDVLDNGGVPTVSYVYYDASNYPDPDDPAAPTDYYWGDETGAAADETLEPGAGVCLTLVEGYEVTITAPYTL